MSFVTNQMFLNNYAQTRLNSQQKVQKSNQNLMNLMGNSQGLSPAELLRREKQITFTSLQNMFLAKCAELAEEALKKQQKKEIERSFNTFA